MEIVSEYGRGENEGGRGENEGGRGKREEGGKSGKGIKVEE